MGPGCEVAMGVSNYAFERPVTRFSSARVRRAGYFAPATRLKAVRPAAQRER